MSFGKSPRPKARLPHCPMEQGWTDGSCFILSSLDANKLLHHIRLAAGALNLINGGA
ncbi:hypothetical protein [Paenibacillus agricola]|uniref:Uncharacterized protein n=1 Tax=Paenibacillus agricola TaxID=2716264 RepID=A0ABX0J135_9BACL|nr:hypothetical protein [Paenibacillus agricola]NHN30007.1 hypothetical protein [Paenibacillus agricola]